MFSTGYAWQILMKLELSLQTFEKNPQVSNIMKTCLVGTKLFHADGRTDVTTLLVALRNLANAPKICISLQPT
jgi:hypothetical protein